MNRATEKSAVVIGGGLAGIAASWQLAEQGFKVTLLESKQRLGGRAGSFESSNGEDVDYCQHVGMGCCTHLLKLISWLGQEDCWDRHRELHFYGPQGKYCRLGALPLPAPLHLSTWIWKWPGLNFKDRMAVAYGMLRIWRMDQKCASELDEIPALKWLREIRQPNTTIDRFWSTILVSALGEALDRVSLAAVCKVMQDGFLKQTDAFHLLVPNQPLSKLFNTDARNALTSIGVDVRLGSGAKQIQHSRTSIRVLAPNDCIEASHVVIAIPWHQIPKLRIQTEDVQEDSSKLSQSEFEKLEASPITGIHTWWDTAWMKKPHAAIVGRQCQWVFPKPTQESTTNQISAGNFSIDQQHNQANEHYYQIVVSASRNLLNVPKAGKHGGDFETALIDDLSQVFPRVRDAKLLRCQAVTDPKSVFSVKAGADKLRPEALSGLRNVMLAGDWTKTGWPATMEGAIRSGFNAATAIGSA